MRVRKRLIGSWSSTGIPVVTAVWGITWDSIAPNWTHSLPHHHWASSFKHKVGSKFSQKGIWTKKWRNPDLNLRLALIDLLTTGPRPSRSWTHALRDSGTVPYQLSWQAQLELGARFCTSSADIQYFWACKLGFNEKFPALSQFNH